MLKPIWNCKGFSPIELPLKIGKNPESKWQITQLSKQPRLCRSNHPEKITSVVLGAVTIFKLVLLYSRRWGSQFFSVGTSYYLFLHVTCCQNIIYRTLEHTAWFWYSFNEGYVLRRCCRNDNCDRRYISDWFTMTGRTETKLNLYVRRLS